MIPTQNDLQDFAEFAKDGTKTAPGEIKNAQGFVPTDVFPANWANYFLNGSTKGITNLNKGVKSVEAEINNVLAGRSITPDEGTNNQLKLAIDGQISAEATARANADNALSNRITNNTTAISNETSARTSADNALSTRISANAAAINILGKVGYNNASSTQTMYAHLASIERQNNYNYGVNVRFTVIEKYNSQSQANIMTFSITTTGSENNILNIMYAKESEVFYYNWYSINLYFRRISDTRIDIYASIIDGRGITLGVINNSIVDGITIYHDVVSSMPGSEYEPYRSNSQYIPNLCIGTSNNTINGAIWIS